MLNTECVCVFVARAKKVPMSVCKWFTVAQSLLMEGGALSLSILRFFLCYDTSQGNAGCEFFCF